MTGRKHASNNKHRLDKINDTLCMAKLVFEELGMEDGYSKIKAILDDARSKQHAIYQKLPVGYRYEGTFFIRKQGTAEFESLKIDGSAYMREDLVSWLIESSKGDVHNPYAYYRDIYKDDKLREPIKREEGAPVYATDVNCNETEALK